MEQRPSGQSGTLEAVRDRIRQGATSIDLRGYSHIFVNGPAEVSSSSGEQDPIPDIRHGLQEVFAREGLRNLVKACEDRLPLGPVRCGLGEQRPWDSVEFRKPRTTCQLGYSADLEGASAGARDAGRFDYRARDLAVAS